MIKAILFDYWGTLAVSEVNDETLQRAHKLSYAYLQQKGYSLSFADYCKRREEGFLQYEDWGLKTGIELLPEETFKMFIFKDIPIKKEDVKALIALNEKYDHNTVIRPECAEVLPTLKHCGYRIALVTNSWVRQAPRELQAAGLVQYFDTVIISCDVGVRKPHQKIFEVTAQQLHVPLRECVFVGDNHASDIHGAFTAGIPYAVGIEPFTAKEDLPPPTAILKNLKELPPLLTKLDSR